MGVRRDVDLFEDENENERRRSTSSKLNAFAGFLYGMSTLILSAMLLNSAKLKIHNYDEKTLRNFPTDLLGCSATTVAASILQIVSALMYFNEELSRNGWKWIKFILTVTYITCFCLLQTSGGDYHNIDYCAYYIYFLLGNSIYCALIFMFAVCTSICN